MLRHDSVHTPLMQGLTIRIPAYIDPLEERIQDLQKALITLEKPYSRSKMGEEERRKAVKNITEKFRAALMQKANLQIGHLPDHSQSASSSDPDKPPPLPSRRYFLAAAEPPE